MLTPDVDGDGRLDIVYQDFFGPRGHGSRSSPSVIPPDPWTHAVRADGTPLWDRCWGGNARYQALLLGEGAAGGPWILALNGVPTAYGLDGVERWRAPIGAPGAQGYRRLTHAPADAPEADLVFTMVNVAGFRGGGTGVAFLDVDGEGVHGVWARDDGPLAHDFTTGDVVRLRGVERPVFVEGNSLYKAGRSYSIRAYEDGATEPFWSERVWRVDDVHVVAEGAHVVVPGGEGREAIDVLVGWGSGLWRYRVGVGVARSSVGHARWAFPAARARSGPARARD